MIACTGYDIMPYLFWEVSMVEDDSASLAHTVSSSSSYDEYIRYRWRAARKMQKKRERMKRKKIQRRKKTIAQARRRKEEAHEAAHMIKREKKRRSSRSQSLRGSPRGSFVIMASNSYEPQQLELEDDVIIPTYTTQPGGSLIIRASEPYDSSYIATQLVNDDATIEDGDQNRENELEVEDIHHYHNHSYFISSSGCEVVHKGR